MTRKASAVASRFAASTVTRFLLSGIVNTLTGLSVSWLALHGIGLSYWPATLSGFLAGWTVGFLLGRHYTFKSGLPLREAVPRYGAVVTSAWLLSAWLGRKAAKLAAVGGIPGVRPFVDIGPDDAAVLFCNGIYVILNYAGQRWIVFRT